MDSGELPILISDKVYVNICLLHKIKISDSIIVLFCVQINVFFMLAASKIRC